MTLAVIALFSPKRIVCTCRGRATHRSQRTSKSVPDLAECPKARTARRAEPPETHAHEMTMVVRNGDGDRPVIFVDGSSVVGFSG